LGDDKNSYAARGWLRSGNMRRRPQIEHFTSAWLGISTKLSEGVRIVEVR